MADSLLSLENPVFRAYLFYSSVLVIKMMFMSMLTGSKRRMYKAYSNPEDTKRQNVKVKVDENVERVRRAHLNDLENITLFFVIGFFYVFTNPKTFLAVNLFRAYTVARIIHTIVYAVVVLPQPARGLSWMVGYAITGYMAVNTLITFII